MDAVKTHGRTIGCCKPVRIAHCISGKNCSTAGRPAGIDLICLQQLKGVVRQTAYSEIKQYLIAGQDRRLQDNGWIGNNRDLLDRAEAQRELPKNHRLRLEHVNAGLRGHERKVGGVNNSDGLLLNIGNQDVFDVPADIIVALGIKAAAGKRKIEAHQGQLAGVI